LYLSTVSLINNVFVLQKIEIVFKYNNFGIHSTTKMETTTATHTVATKDGIETVLPDYIVSRFTTLKNVIGDTADDTATIPLAAVSKPTLDILVAYLMHYIEKNDPMVDFGGFCVEKKEELTPADQEKYERWVIYKKFLDDWEKDFYSNYSDDVLMNEFYTAADYLNCPFLMDSFKVEVIWRTIRGNTMGVSLL